MQKAFYGASDGVNHLYLFLPPPFLPSPAYQPSSSGASSPSSRSLYNVYFAYRRNAYDCLSKNAQMRAQTTEKMYRSWRWRRRRRRVGTRLVNRPKIVLQVLRRPDTVDMGEKAFRMCFITYVRTRTRAHS